MRHQAGLVERPVLIAITAEPVTGVVMPFVGEAHSDAWATHGPHFLDQSIFQFAGPLTPEKSQRSGATVDKLRAIAPSRVFAVAQYHPARVATVPRVFGQTHLLRGSFERERRQRWSIFHGLVSTKCLKYGRISTTGRDAGEWLAPPSGSTRHHQYHPPGPATRDACLVSRIF